MHPSEGGWRQRGEMIMILGLWNRANDIALNVVSSILSSGRHTDGYTATRPRGQFPSTFLGSYTNSDPGAERNSSGTTAMPASAANVKALAQLTCTGRNEFIVADASFVILSLISRLISKISVSQGKCTLYRSLISLTSHNSGSYMLFEFSRRKTHVRVYEMTTTSLLFHSISQINLYSSARKIVYKQICS